MAEDGLWRPKRRREARVHQRRPRRARLGELVRVDGSPHDWFEGRAPRCALIVFIDDATSRLLALRFCRSETTEAYMETLRGHLAAHGRPVALHSDRYSVFRVNRKDGGDVPTRFTRALPTLRIEPVHAGTPQAKGRVERANLTLRDRLVKEMRLRGIGGMEAANTHLPEFMADHNRRFAVAPREAEDAHRPVLHDAEELDLILCEQATRKLSKNLTFKFERRECQLVGEGKGRRLRGAAVTVRKGFDGAASVLLKGASWRTGCWRRARRRFRSPTRRTCGSGWTRRRRNRRRGRTGSRRRTIRGAGRSSPRRRSAPRHEVAPGRDGASEPAPRFPPSFHRRFCDEGGSRPWKDGGKRYSHEPDGSARAGALIGLARRQRGHFCFAQKGTFLLCVDSAQRRGGHGGRLVATSAAVGRVP